MTLVVMALYLSIGLLIAGSYFNVQSFQGENFTTKEAFVVGACFMLVWPVVVMLLLMSWLWSIPRE